MRIVCILLLICSCQTVLAQSAVSDSLISILYQSPEQDTSTVRLMVQLADALSKESNYKDAETQIVAAETLAETLGDLGLKAEVSLYKGIIYYRQSKFNNAVIPFKSAINNFHKVANTSGAALASHWLGNSYYELGQYDLALNKYLEAYSKRETLGDKRGMAFTLSNIGNVYIDQRDFDKALFYHEKSLTIKKELNDSRSLAFSYNNIANIYQGKNNLEKALEYYNNALLIFTDLNFKHGLAFTLGNIGKVYAKQKEYKRALEFLNEAATLLEEENNTKGLAEALNHIGNISLQLKQYQQAANALDKAGQLALRAEVSSELIENYLNRAKLDSARGNMTGAFSWMKKHMELKENVFNADKSRQMAEMQTAFDTERKDKAIALLETEKDYQRSQRVVQRVVFISVVTVLLLITTGLVYFLRQKNTANAILEAQKMRSEELNQLKDKLFSIIAHDLRSPLQSLKGVLSLAGDHGISETELKYLLGAIGQNTQYTIDLVDNLLTWSKDNLQGSSVNSEPFDVKEIVQENVKLLSQQALNKGITIKNTIREKVQVYADRNMIDVVLRNLLSNAIKFTMSNGEVTIGHTFEKGCSLLCIEDNGVGIPVDQQKKLFGTANISTRGTSNEKGTGLGLILCKDFVEKNGGKVWVESDFGKGSKFFIRLPSANDRSNKNLEAGLVKETILQTAV